MAGKGTSGYMANDLKVGDVVQLKSGGPKMTIEGIGKYGLGGSKEQAKCTWFAGAERQSSVFDIEALVKI